MKTVGELMIELAKYPPEQEVAVSTLETYADTAWQPDSERSIQGVEDLETRVVITLGANTTDRQEDRR